MRIISPYPAGIGPDLVMRVVAEQLSQTWKQPVVIDARTGGSGIPAMEALKAAAPDGHTLAVAGDAQLAINPFVHRSLSYDPRADFAPIMRLISTPFVIIVAAKGPYQSVPDLIADARAAPGKVIVRRYLRRKSRPSRSGAVRVADQRPDGLCALSR